MKTILLFIIFVAFSFPVYGMIIGSVKVKGTVVSYDKKKVTLKNKKGKRVKVSRRAIPKKFKLRTGAQVYALLKPEVIARRLSSTNRRHSKAGKRNKKRRKR